MGLIEDLATSILGLPLRVRTLELQMAQAQAIIAGLPNNPSTPPAGATRTLKNDHIRLRAIFRSPSSGNAADIIWMNDHVDDIDGPGTLSTYPKAITAQRYGLMISSEIDSFSAFTPAGAGGSWSAAHDDSLHIAMCRDFSATFATAHSLSVELLWVHAASGARNYPVGVTSISAAGKIEFNNPNNAGRVTSFPFAVGQTITLTGLSAGNGTYVIASLQKNGVTITGWAGGNLSVGAAFNTTSIGTLFIPGTGAATLANRKTFFYFSEWRQVINYNNSNARAMNTARLVFGIANLGNPVNCFLIDEFGGNAYNNANDTLEYGAGVQATAFVTDMCLAFTEALADPAGPTFFRVNTATYLSAFDIQVARAAKGIHGEQLLNRFAYDKATLDYAIARIAEGIDVEFIDGGVWKLAQNNGGVTPVPGVWLEHSGTTPGNYPDVSQRGQMGSYGFYLLAVDATVTALNGSKSKHLMFDQTNSVNPGDIPVSARYAPALFYNVGQPVGPYSQTAVMVDSSGANTRVLTRRFSRDGGATLSAYVVYTSVVNGQTNWGDNSVMNTTLPTPPAGKTWRLLQWDGTPSAASYTTVGTRRGEAVVMVPA